MRRQNPPGPRRPRPRRGRLDTVSSVRTFSPAAGSAEQLPAGRAVRPSHGTTKEPDLVGQLAADHAAKEELPCSSTGACSTEEPPSVGKNCSGGSTRCSASSTV